MAQAIHESRSLIQARPKGQDVDLKRIAPATPSRWDIISHIQEFVNSFLKYCNIKGYPIELSHRVASCYFTIGLLDINATQSAR